MPMIAIWHYKVPQEISDEMTGYGGKVEVNKELAVVSHVFIEDRKESRVFL